MQNDILRVLGRAVMDTPVTAVPSVPAWRLGRGLLNHSGRLLTRQAREVLRLTAR